MILEILNSFNFSYDKNLIINLKKLEILKQSNCRIIELIEG